ncbi:hypothetical protein G6F68_019313 [Rhizopus microsporus]|nr:hypothetical protein G6F68_019313 [Rhizopus microsporus]
MSFDFVGTLWPGDLIFIECRLGALRTRSFDIELEARRPDGSAVFSAVFSPICVRQDERIGTPVPAALRAVLLAHGACEIHTHEGAA